MRIRFRRLRLRLRDESGMGLIELLIAMVILNIGLFAVVSVFSGATMAMGRAATVSAAAAVADKQMELYRSLQNCGIWLDPATFPTANAGTPYQADTKSYTDQFTGLPITFLDKSAGTTAIASLPWATSATTQVVVVPWNGDIPTSCTPASAPAYTPPATATSAIQNVTGPDGVQYSVYTYIILTQGAYVDAGGNDYNGRYEKQVTVVVHDPRTPAKILARQTSLFNPFD